MGGKEATCMVLDDLISQLSFKEGKYVKTGMVVNKEHVSRMYTFCVRISLISELHKCARLCDGHCLGFI